MRRRRAAVAHDGCGPVTGHVLREIDLVVQRTDGACGRHDACASPQRRSSLRRAMPRHLRRPERKAATDGAHRRVSPADRFGGCDGEDPIQNSWSEFTCIQSLRPEAGRRIPVHPTGGRLNRIGIRPSMHVINRKRCATGRRSSVSESDIHRGRCRCARERAACICLAVPRLRPRARPCRRRRPRGRAGSAARRSATGRRLRA